MPARRPAPVPDFLYGTAWKEDRTPALTELALRAGFRGIDTANQRRHYFEAGVGQGLAAAYRAGVVTRADLFLQTKFTYQHGQDHRLPYVSNVGLWHLEQMAATGAEAPAFVQDRCFARMGWGRDVRAFCASRKIVYQGFSLLTANPEVLHHSRVARIAARAKATPAQVVFRFAQAVGMLPLTGTTDAEHMKQDLASRDLSLSTDEVRAIESLAG